MSSDQSQRLSLEDLDAVLARAKVKRWTELALIGRNRSVYTQLLVQRGWLSSCVFELREELKAVPPALLEIDSLTSLDLARNQIGNGGAEALARLSSLTSLGLTGNGIGDAGAEALARRSGLTSLDLMDNRIGNAGAEALARRSGLTTLNLFGNRIGDAGAEALARLSGLTSLNLNANWISDAGARALLDAWADPATADRRRQLDLRYNPIALLPWEVLEQTDAQGLIAAWRRFREAEAGEQPLPEPEAVGSPSPTGLRISVGDDGRLRFDDAPLAEGARDDEIGRELHGEVIEALDRLIVAAGRSNTVAVWREAAEGAKQRLGTGPREVRFSALLRIERLRGLREADERRRSEPDPLVEPAEAGVAAALGDAVAAANLYIQTDPYLAEQQQRLADPGMKLELTVEEAAAAEVDLEELDVAAPELLDELRQGRETAVLGGAAGERARVWLAGSWRNVFREMMRQVLAAVRTAAMDAKVGAVITIADGEAALQALGLDAKLKLAEGSRQALASLGRIWLSAEPELGKGVAQAVKWGSVLLLARHLELLPRLGWSPELVAALRRLLGM